MKTRDFITYLLIFWATYFIPVVISQSNDADAICDRTKDERKRQDALQCSLKEAAKKTPSVAAVIAECDSTIGLTDDKAQALRKFCTEHAVKSGPITVCLLQILNPLKVPFAEAVKYQADLSDCLKDLKVPIADKLVREKRRENSTIAKV